MKVKERCPECHQQLVSGMHGCKCGWRANKDEEKLRDHRCQYQSNGKRCPMPGTMSPSIWGQGTWYCCEHWRHLGDPKICEERLMDAEMNFEKIMEERIHWTIKLIPEEYASAKKEIKNLYLQLIKK